PHDPARGGGGAYSEIATERFFFFAYRHREGPGNGRQGEIREAGGDAYRAHRRILVESLHVRRGARDRLQGPGGKRAGGRYGGECHHPHCSALRENLQGTNG